MAEDAWKYLDRLQAVVPSGSPHPSRSQPMDKLSQLDVMTNQDLLESSWVLRRPCCPNSELNLEFQQEAAKVAPVRPHRPTAV